MGIRKTPPFIKNSKAEISSVVTVVGDLEVSAITPASLLI
jgi:hypothetical protein